MPLEARRSDGAAEHRLAVRHAGERRRVEARERVKRVALDPRALDRRVQELQIEERIVTDEDRAVQLLLLDLLADLLEQARVTRRPRRRRGAADEKDRCP